MVFRLLLFFISLSLYSDIGYHPPWGSDSALSSPREISISPSPRFDVLSKMSEKIILFHQNVLSPIDGGWVLEDCSLIFSSNWAEVVPSV